MPNYKTHDPKGWCGDPRRGAALGRPTVIEGDPETFTGKLVLRKIRVGPSGYDPNGTYFGYVPGLPIYWVAGEDDEHEIDFVLRASTREAAKEKVLMEFPNARFFR